MNDKQLRNLVIGMALGVSGFGLAAVSLPNTFSAGTQIKSSEVNANFTALKTALETAGGINDGAITAAKLNVTGSIADGKVLKAQGGNLVWGDDNGGTSYTAGAGLALTGNAFSVKFPLTGSISSADSAPIGLSITSSDASKTAIKGLGGNYGVVGDSLSPTGVGVLAASSAGGAALEVSGAIKVSGSNAPAFVHVANATNSASNYTCLDHPLTNGKPNALLLVTHNFNPNGASTSTGVYFNKAFGVFYTGTISLPNNRWCIYADDGASAIPANAAFNVLVVNP